MEYRWMSKCFFSMYRDVVVGDSEHAYYSDCGRCVTIQLHHIYWLLISLFLGLYGPMGLGCLSICVSCSLSVMIYLGSRENALMPIGFWGSWARSKESLGMLHMNFVSLIRTLSNFLMFGTKQWSTYKTYLMSRRIIVFRIFTFCCSDADNSNRAVLYFLFFVIVISLCMAHFRDRTSRIPSYVYSLFL